MNLTVVENGLIPVYETEQETKAVSARELHEFLESKRQFTDWIKDRVNKYGFIENEDYITFSQNCESGGRTIEYILKLDVAKEIAMVENNEKGRQVRKYFIEVEKKVHQPKSLEDLIIMQAQSVKALKQKVDTLETSVQKLEANTGKADVLEQRLNNLFNIDLSQPQRDILNSYIRKYAITKYNNNHTKAWHEFYKAFYYVTNLKVKQRADNANMTGPKWLEVNGYLDQAIRIADNLLNQ